MHRQRGLLMLLLRRYQSFSLSPLQLLITYITRLPFYTDALDFNVWTSPLSPPLLPTGYKTALNHQGKKVVIVGACTSGKSEI
jgi:hypothetical protein